MNETPEARMREDWNARAREDANYYVAFGRRGQPSDEFFSTAEEMVRAFERELRRLPPGNPRARRALEIGCGPGRLMLPLARHFGEIHGVDISDEMIRLAREHLAGVSHAHAHHTPSSDLAAFADDSFDFVYSYAVFQHIPYREVVERYFRETRRVLKTGGIARFQVNGLPETAARYDTWNGVRIPAADIAAFARENDFQLLALEGAGTQYLWTTWRKRPAGWFEGLASAPPPKPARLVRITNTYSSEPAAPSRGRFAAVSLWFEHLPPECDLNRLEISIGGERAFATYIGPPEEGEPQQVNALVPAGLASGLQPVEVLWLGRPLCPPAMLRVVPAGPAVPRLVRVSDGIDLLSGTRIVTGSVKLVIEELERPEEFTASIGGRPVGGIDHFCVDPRVPSYEINFRIPEDLPPGPARLEISLGRRRLGPVELEIAAGRSGNEGSLEPPQTSGS